MISFIRSITNLSRGKQRVMALSLVAIVPLSVIAYASIPDLSGTIYGCYKKSGGTIRIVDYPAQQCDARAEALLPWNQTGPEGPQGPIGPQGPAGYSLATSASGAANLPAGISTQILSKELPAGNWVIAGRASVGADRQTFDETFAAINCELRSGDTVIGRAQDWGNEKNQLISRTLPLNGIATLPNGGTISVWCTGRVSEGGFSGGGSSEVTIIQVNNVF